jgi:hypothetical protein
VEGFELTKSSEMLWQSPGDTTVARYVLYARDILAEARDRAARDQLEHQVLEEQMSNSVESSPVAPHEEGNVTHPSHRRTVTHPVDAAGEEALLSQPQGHGKDWASAQEMDQIKEIVRQLRVLPLCEGGEDDGQEESLDAARVRVLYDNLQSLGQSIVTK